MSDYARYVLKELVHTVGLFIVALLLFWVADIAHEHRYMILHGLSGVTSAAFAGLSILNFFSIKGELFW